MAENLFSSNAPMQVGGEGSFAAIGAEWMQSFVPQVAMEAVDGFLPYQPGYDALAPENIAGYEDYREAFINSRGPEHQASIKRRIDDNNARSDLINREGGFWTSLAAAGLDPINFIPLPAAKGLGLLRGAALGGVSNAAIDLGSQYATTFVSPTHTMDEGMAGALYSGLFGAVLGGIGGMRGTRTAQEYGRLFMDENRALDRQMGGVSPEVRAPDIEPAEEPVMPAIAGKEGTYLGTNEDGLPVWERPNGTRVALDADGMASLESPNLMKGNFGDYVRPSRFEVVRAAADAEPVLSRETGAQQGSPKLDVDEFKVEPTPDRGYGLAPAFGVEKVVGPITLITRSIQSGVKAIGDLAQSMVGEFSVKTTDNQAGVASPPSALFRSKYWVAFAQDADAGIQDAWSKMRGAASGLKIGGLDVAASGMKMGDKVRGAGTDGLPTLPQFKDILFKAAVAQDLEAFLLRQDERIVGALRAALPPIRNFFEEAGREAVRTGAIRTSEFMRRQGIRWQNDYANTQTRLKELMQKPVRTPNEEAEMVLQARKAESLYDRLERMDLEQTATGDEALSAKIDEIMEKGEARRANAANLAERIRAQVATTYEWKIATRDGLRALGDTRGLTPKQQELLDRLEKEITPQRENDLAEFKAAEPIAPFVRRDPKFDPPANDANVVVDKWEGRRAELNAVDEFSSPANALRETLAGFDEKLAQAFDEHLPHVAPHEIEGLARRLVREDARIWADRILDKYAPDVAPGMRQMIRDFAAEPHPEGGHPLGFDDLDPDLPREAVNSLSDLQSGLTGSLKDLEDAVTFRAQRLKGLDYETGKPAVFDAFHGTNYLGPEEGFDLAQGGKTTGALSAKEGIFFARNPETSMAYTVDGAQKTPLEIENELAMMKQMGMDGPQMVMARVRFENPLVVDMAGMAYQERQFTKRAQQAKDAGHDGAIYLNTQDGGPLDVVYIAFAPDQIRHRFNPGQVQAKVFGVSAPAGPRAAANDNPNVGEPPVRDGFVRVYHSGSAGDGDSGRWVSTNRQYAADYRADLPLYYTDLPATDPRVNNPDYPDQGVRQGHTFNFELRPDEAARLTETPRDARSNVGQPTPGQQQLLTALDEQANGPALTEAQRAYVQSMLQKLMRGEIEYKGPEKNYMPRLWDHDKIREGQPRLQRILEQHYREQGLDDVEGRATRTIDAILSHDPMMMVEDNDAPRGKTRSARFDKRAIDIPTEKVADFVRTDVSELLHDYARSTGASIEFARQFGGDPFAKDAFHDAMIQAAREITADSAEDILAKIDKHRVDLIHARDAGLGRLRAGMPLTVDAVAVRALKNWSATTMLGKVALTALVETGRSVMVRGLVDTFEATFAMLANRTEAKGAIRSMQLLGGEGLELFGGMAASRYMEMGGVTSRMGSPAAMAMDRKLAGINNLSETTYYVANGLALVTDILKNWTQGMSAHFMVRDIQRVASGQASPRDIANLAAYGIDAKTARAIVDQADFQTAGRLNLANLDAFTDPKLRSIFVNAVVGETRRTIVSPGVADKSIIQQGFTYSGDVRKEHALLTLPFQFMSWAIAANNKILLSSLQGRDANALGGIVALTGMAYFVNYLKSGGGGAWGQMEFEDKLLLAVEQSGVLGQLTDVNNLIETGTVGAFGVRPLLGMDPKWGRKHEVGDAATIPAGPVGSKFRDMYKLFDPDVEQTEKASIGRRAIFGNNIFYLDGAFKGAQRMIFD